VLGREDLHVIEYPGDVPLEENFDWALNSSVMPAARNQGGCGSCWAFATVGAIESSVAITTGLDVRSFRVSEQQLVDCAPNPNNCGGTGGCQGSTQGLGLDYFMKNGFDLLGDGRDEATDAYTQSDGKCATNTTARPGILPKWGMIANNDLESLMFAISTYGPVAVAVDAGAFQGYNGGIVEHCGTDLDHAVLAVGYGCDERTESGDWGKCWIKIRNSWGSDWGECADHTATECGPHEKGYIRLHRLSLKENARRANEECGMDISTKDGLGCMGENEDIRPRNTMVCGTCGVLYKPVVPMEARLTDAAIASVRSKATQQLPGKEEDPIELNCRKQGMVVDVASCNALGCKCKSP
jgi:cathepsin L